MPITGADIDLPLLIQAATVRSTVAERLVWHSHEGVELIFLLVGSTAYEFERGRTLALPGGHFLVVPAQTQHRGLHNVRMPSTLAGVTFDPRRGGIGAVAPFTRAELNWLASRFDQCGAGVHSFGPRLKEAVRHLKTDIANWAGNQVDLGQKASLRTLICAVILEAARELAQSPIQRPNEIVRAAMEYMRARFDEPLHVSALTRHLGLSRARVFDLFTSETGLTPHNFLLRLRLEKAEELLRETRQSVTEIAFATGFASSQHFSRVFRKYHGETPCECRGSAEGGTPNRERKNGGT